MIKKLIKSSLKVLAVGTFLYELFGTKKGKEEGNVQIHPIKFSGRTLFIREQEVFIRESFIEGKPV